MRVRLNFPIFSSPTEAWGDAHVDVDLPALPANGGWLDVPMTSQELAELGMTRSMLVTAVVDFGNGSNGVLLDGVVADGAEAAAQIAQILEEEFDVDITEWDHTLPPMEELVAALEVQGARGFVPASDTWLSIYGRWRGATIIGMKSEASNLWIEIDDAGAGEGGDAPAQPGSLVLLSADRSRTELASIIGKQVVEAHMVETERLDVEFVDHAAVTIHAGYIVWVPRHLLP